jgi:hypothetical protein
MHATSEGSSGQGGTIIRPAASRTIHQGFVGNAGLCNQAIVLFDVASILQKVRFKTANCMRRPEADFQGDFSPSTSYFAAVGCCDLAGSQSPL